MSRKTMNTIIEEEEEPEIKEIPIGDEEATVEKPATPPQQQQPQGGDDFPEGGWSGWLAVVGGVIMIFCSWGSIQSFGVFEDYYTRVRLRHNTPSEISWIGSVQIFLLCITGPWAGRLFDRGYAHHILLAGSTLYILSSLMLSVAEEGDYVQHFLFQGIGMGLSMGLMFLPAITIPSHYFRVRRPIAIGIVTTGGSIGAVLKAAILNNVLARGTFSRAIKVVAFMELGLLVVANLIIRTRLKVDPRAQRPSLVSFLKDGYFVVYLLGTSCAFWGMYVPYFYVQLFATFHSVPVKITHYAVSIMNIASLFGRTTPNLVAQKVGNMNIIIPCTFLTGSLAWTLLGAKNVGGVVGFATAYGFFSGGIIALFTPACVSFAKNLNEMGTRSGLQMLFIAFTALTGNPIAGVLLDPPRYLWWRPLLFASAVVCLGGALMVVARHGLVKRKGTWCV